MVDPHLPIFDAHHHLWDRPDSRFLIDDLLAEIGASGHRVVGTALVESGTFTLAPGGDARARDEAALAASAAVASAARDGGAIRACSVIVGHVDLRGGKAVDPAIAALRDASGGRLRGIRHCASWDADEEVRGGPAIAPPGLYADPAFREGLRVLQAHGLAFDAWAYQTQHAEVLDLVRAFPDLRIVYDHTGGVLGIGPYAGKQDALYAQWRHGMRALADCPNLHVKLGGLGMRRSGFTFYGREAQPAGAELATAWRPWLEHAIELFGPARCMFESNFPVDRASFSYRAWWNACKFVSAGLPEEDRRLLLHDTAARFYHVSREEPP